MGRTETVAHDPSAPSGHLPGFAREEHSGGRNYALLASASFSAILALSCSGVRRTMCSFWWL